MEIMKLVCFTLIDLVLVLCSYKMFGKVGIIMMYIIHIIISQLTIKLQIKVENNSVKWFRNIQKESPLI